MVRQWFRGQASIILKYLKAQIPNPNTLPWLNIRASTSCSSSVMTSFFDYRFFPWLTMSFTTFTTPHTEKLTWESLLWHPRSDICMCCHEVIVLNFFFLDLQSYLLHSSHFSTVLTFKLGRVEASKPQWGRIYQETNPETHHELNVWYLRRLYFSKLSSSE